MAQVLLFHSALGIRPGVTDLADALRDADHSVHVVDQYDGRSFDDSETAMAHVDQTGFPELMRIALESSAAVIGPFVAVGFSNGAGMAQHAAAQRPEDARGVLMIGGGLPMRYLDAAWPAGVPGEVHASEDDPCTRTRRRASCAGTSRPRVATWRWCAIPRSGPSLLRPETDRRVPARGSAPTHRAGARLRHRDRRRAGARTRSLTGRRPG